MSDPYDHTAMLEPQDWSFPVPIAYGPGRLVEIGVQCAGLGICAPLVVTAAPRASGVQPRSPCRSRRAPSSTMCSAATTRRGAPPPRRCGYGG